MTLQKKNLMTIYVHKSTRVIAFKALRANEGTTLSSGVYHSDISNLRFPPATLMLLSRHIDGHDYFYALSEMLDSARECIFIMVCVSLALISAILVTLVKDWWLSPELYLRRPPAYHPEWRLDKILRRKAQQGVKIYVIVYKEVRIYNTTINDAPPNSILTCKRLPNL
jgi:phosphatidylserine/phosphatidylglycerophosphate/cardiolipin synthase-like enzyme